MGTQRYYIGDDDAYNRQLEQSTSKYSQIGESGNWTNPLQFANYQDALQSPMIDGNAIASGKDDSGRWYTDNKQDFDWGPVVMSALSAGAGALGAGPMNMASSLFDNISGGASMFPDGPTLDQPGNSGGLPYGGNDMVPDAMEGSPLQNVADDSVDPQQEQGLDPLRPAVPPYDSPGSDWSKYLSPQDMGQSAPTSPSSGSPLDWLKDKDNQSLLKILGPIALVGMGAYGNYKNSQNNKSISQQNQQAQTARRAVNDNPLSYPSVNAALHTGTPYLDRTLNSRGWHPDYQQAQTADDRNYFQNPNLQYHAAGGMSETSPQMGGLRAASRLAQGPGGGQDDVINARLSDGEYVMDADTVASIGDGSTQEGARRLDKARMELRKHKRGAPASKIPPKSKPFTKYLPR